MTSHLSIKHQRMEKARVIPPGSASARTPWAVTQDILIFVGWATVWTGCLALPAVLQPIGIVLTLLLFLQIHLKGPASSFVRLELVPVKPCTARGWLFIGLCSVPMVAFGLSLDSLYYRLPFVRPHPFAAHDFSETAALERLALILLLVATAPVIEEIVFRGWIQQRLLRSFRAYHAIAVSSLAFALIHLQPSWIPFYFVVGAIQGYAVHLTGSIWTGVWLHTSNNAAVALLMPWFGTPPDADRWVQTLTGSLWSGLITATAGALLLVIGLHLATAHFTSQPAYPKT